MGSPVGVTVRPATAADSEAVVAVVRACWTAYPGVVFDLDGELPELGDFARHYRACGGCAWVALLDGTIAGCIATAPEPTPDIWMLHKLNVLPSARRRGIGGLLVTAAETYAQERGAREMALWSDTRFVESHALYAKLGYERRPGTRDLHDLSNTTEYCFRKRLQPGFAARK